MRGPGLISQLLLCRMLRVRLDKDGAPGQYLVQHLQRAIVPYTMRQLIKRSSFDKLVQAAFSLSRVTGRARVDSAANDPKDAKIRKFDGSCNRTSETIIRTTTSNITTPKTIKLPVPSAIQTLQFIPSVIVEISIAAEQVTKSGLLLRERTTATGTGQSNLTSPSWIRGQSGPSISRLYQAHCHNATSPFKANQAFISAIWATRTIHGLCG
jgi:hypothetical protein